MALQDQPQTPPSMIDPATGQPYPFGSAQYEAAIAPWLTGQIAAQSNQAANGRGTYYSGPAMADEIQAEQGALNTMAQQGAQQSVQQQELQQQEQFQQQLQSEQNQANMNATKAAAKGQMVAGAVQGGTGALGQLGGLYAYQKMFGPKTPSPDGAVTPGVPDVGVESNAAGGVDEAPISDVVSSQEATPDIFSTGSGVDPMMSTGALPADGSISATGVPDAGVGGDALNAMAASPAAYGMGALAALPAAYYGAGAGERTFGDSNADKVAAGVGGAVGGGIGALAGPWGVPVGAAAGSFLGPGVVSGANWLGARLGI